MDDRRTTQRQKTFLAGKIIYGANRFETECSVRDLSANGARLALSDVLAIPNEFELHLPARHMICRVEVRWRRGRQIGVSFRSVRRLATRVAKVLADAI